MFLGLRVVTAPREGLPGHVIQQSADDAQPLQSVPGLGVRNLVYHVDLRVLASPAADAGFRAGQHPTSAFGVTPVARLEGFARDGVSELELAFSRQNGQKVYVQDRVRARGDDVWQMLEDGGHIYICGDGNHMAPAVREAFCAIHQQKTGSSAEAAAAWATGLMDQQRYLLDVWAG